MFRLSKNSSVPVLQALSIPLTKGTIDKVVAIDTFDSQDFNKNDAGWIRNDLAQLARATSQSQYDSIMRRLVELHASGSIPEGVSNEDALKLLRPHFAQTPDELVTFAQRLANADMSALSDAYQKALEAEPLPPEPASSSIPNAE